MKQFIKIDVRGQNVNSDMVKIIGQKIEEKSYGDILSSQIDFIKKQCCFCEFFKMVNICLIV